mgnify:CR=1 FL=1
MMIEIRAIGGYEEIGRNMTAVNVGGEVIILDMGLELESYINISEDDDIVDVDTAVLEKAGAIPKISALKDWKEKVIAIVPSHAHLDHIGAIPFLLKEFDAPLICTPFTSAVIQKILEDEKIKVKNQFRTLYANSSVKLSDKITLEFIHVTHSTPQAVIVALHTKYGTILYANDFKFDLYPVLGKKPNFKRLEELGKNKSVLALVTESTYADDFRKMPSESVARQMLKDIMIGSYSQGKAIIITTFASHLARLKSIIDFSKKLNRKPIFLGRSFAKYISAGEETGIIDFSKDSEVIKYRTHINRTLKKVLADGKEKYVLIVSGHQGEPKAALSRMARGETPFVFDGEDHIIFSSPVIPNPLNQQRRKELEAMLSHHHVRIFRDIHVSGHAAREDLRDLLLMVKPEHIIPTHGEHEHKGAFLELAKEMGLNIEKVHILKNGEGIQLD